MPFHILYDGKNLSSMEQTLTACHIETGAVLSVCGVNGKCVWPVDYYGDLTSARTSFVAHSLDLRVNVTKVGDNEATKCEMKSTDTLGA